MIEFGQIAWNELPSRQRSIYKHRHMHDGTSTESVTRRWLRQSWGVGRQQECGEWTASGECAWYHDSGDDWNQETSTVEPYYIRLGQISLETTYQAGDKEIKVLVKTDAIQGDSVFHPVFSGRLNQGEWFKPVIDKRVPCFESMTIQV